MLPVFMKFLTEHRELRGSYWIKGQYIDMIMQELQIVNNLKIWVVAIRSWTNRHPQDDVKCEKGWEGGKGWMEWGSNGDEEEGKLGLGGKRFQQMWGLLNPNVLPGLDPLIWWMKTCASCVCWGGGNKSNVLYCKESFRYQNSPTGYSEAPHWYSWITMGIKIWLKN